MSINLVLASSLMWEIGEAYSGGKIKSSLVQRLEKGPQGNETQNERERKREVFFKDVMYNYEGNTKRTNIDSLKRM